MILSFSFKNIMYTHMKEVNKITKQQLLRFFFIFLIKKGVSVSSTESHY